ncbi:MAG: hypothetical protein AB7U41_01085 [Dongiaceae bacterium]
MKKFFDVCSEDKVRKIGGVGVLGSLPIKMGDNKEALKVRIISEHLPYEIGMFYMSLTALESSTNQFTTNILIESFCLHARNLIQFFYYSPSKDYAVAEELMIQGYKIPNRKEAIGSQIYKKINLQITHLTYQRARTGNEKINTEDREKLKNMINDCVKKFYENLRSEYKEAFPKNLSSFMK